MSIEKIVSETHPIAAEHRATFMQTWTDTVRLEGLIIPYGFTCKKVRVGPLEQAITTAYRIDLGQYLILGTFKGVIVPPNVEVNVELENPNSPMRPVAPEGGAPGPGATTSQVGESMVGSVTWHFTRIDVKAASETPKKSDAPSPSASSSPPPVPMPPLDDSDPNLAASASSDDEDDSDPELSNEDDMADESGFVHIVCPRATAEKLHTLLSTGYRNPMEDTALIYTLEKQAVKEKRAKPRPGEVLLKLTPEHHAHLYAHVKNQTPIPAEHKADITAHLEEVAKS